jgi:hypothetical protein
MFFLFQTKWSDIDLNEVTTFTSMAISLGLRFPCTSSYCIKVIEQLLIICYFEINEYARLLHDWFIDPNLKSDNVQSCTNIKKKFQLK